MRYTAVIVDDERDAREALSILLGRYTQEIDVIGEADGLTTARELLSATMPDIVFIDVELGKGLIFELLEEIKVTAKLIFTTGHEKYALPAIKARAVDYLLKPIRSKDLIAAVKMASELLEQEKLTNRSSHYDVRRLALPVKDQIRLTDIEDIIYLKADNNYTHFCLKNDQTIVVAKTLKYFEEELPQENFIRVHQSFLVHTKYIKRLDIRSSQLHLFGNAVVPVSRSKKQLLKRFLKAI